MADSYYARNREKVLAKRRQHYAENREAKLEASRRHRQKPEVQARNRERMREYMRSLPEEIRHAKNLYSVHGITPPEKQAMLDAQSGCCYLCGDEIAYDEAVIDHDHSCCTPVPTRRGIRSRSCAGCRRGLACGRCNTLIGMARDDPQRLIRIASALSAAQQVVDARVAAKPQQLGLFAAVATDG